MMVLLYTTLVMKNMKTFDEVPNHLKEAVRASLIEYGYKFPENETK